MIKTHGKNNYNAYKYNAYKYNMKTIKTYIMHINIA